MPDVVISASVNVQWLTDYDTPYRQIETKPQISTLRGKKEEEEEKKEKEKKKEKEERRQKMKKNSCGVQN